MLMNLQTERTIACPLRDVLPTTICKMTIHFHHAVTILYHQNRWAVGKTCLPYRLCQATLAMFHPIL